MALRWTLTGLVFIATIAAALLAFRGETREADDLLRYRLPLVEGESIEAGIAFLEGRVAERPAEGLDLAELASLQLEMSRRTGDRRWLESAETSARRSLENLPVSNDGATLTLAKVANARHELAEAVRLAGLVLAGSPHSADALSVRATAHLALGDLSAALADADGAVAASPRMGALSLRGTVLEAMGRDVEALKSWRDALRVEDTGQVASSAQVRARIARWHLRRGDLGVARAWAEEARRLSPGQPIALFALAELESLDGNAPAAERACNAGFQFTKDPAFLTRLGSVRDRAGDDAGAERAWTQAEVLLREELAAGHSGHRVELARVLLARGGAERAAEALALTTAEIQSRRPADVLAVHASAVAAAGAAGNAR